MNDFTGRADAAADLLTAIDGQDGRVPLLKPIGGAVTSAGLARRATEARALAASLAVRGVGAVAITMVDCDSGGVWFAALAGWELVELVADHLREGRRSRTWATTWCVPLRLSLHTIDIHRMRCIFDPIVKHCERRV